MGYAQDSADAYKQDQSESYDHASSDVNDRQSNVRIVPDSLVRKMKKGKDFLYANDPNYWKKEKPRDNSALYKFLEAISGSIFLKGVLYFLLAVLVIFILYQVIAVNNFFIFSRPGKKKKSAGKSEEASANKENTDQKIRMAIDAGDYRSAIRLMYLNTLWLLNEKQLIRLHAKSTNYDYMKQMQQRKGAKEFQLVTRIYEYVWYGEFQPSEQQFKVICSNFNQFIATT